MKIAEFEKEPGWEEPHYFLPLQLAAQMPLGGCIQLCFAHPGNFTGADAFMESCLGWGGPPCHSGVQYQDAIVALYLSHFHNNLS